MRIIILPLRAHMHVLGARKRIKLNLVPQVHVPEPCAKTVIANNLGPRIILAIFNATPYNLDAMSWSIQQSFLLFFSDW